MKGHLVMSRKELRRKTVYERVKEGEMTIMEASPRATRGWSNRIGRV